MLRKTAFLLFASSCAVADFLCPDSNGQMYTSSSGATFQVQCGSDHSGGDMGSGTTNTFIQCMDLCSSTAGCVDVSYSGVACYMKSSVGAVISNGVRGGIMISNGSSTTTIVTSSSSAAQGTMTPIVVNSKATVTVPSCPASDGSSYVSQGGLTFSIECGIDHAGGDMQMNSTSTFQTCIDLCSTTSGCVDISYVGTSCYMKRTLGVAGSNNNVYGARLVNSNAGPGTSTGSLSSSTKVTTSTISSVSATPSSLFCPAADGTTFTSTNGNTYTVKCGMDGNANDISNKQVSSLDACINLCSTTANCEAVSWVAGKPTGPCYMKSAWVKPSANSGVWGASLLLASNSTSTPSTMITITSSSTATSSNASPTTMITMTSALTSPSFSSSSATSSSSGIPATKGTNSGSGCGSALPLGLTPGGSSQTMSIITSDGLNRTFLVYIPARYSATNPNALLFSYHGAGNSAAGQESLTGFSQSSTNPDIIAVYPQGVNNYWQGAPYSTAGVDDIAFTKQMILTLQSQLCIDNNRLYATGHSNGGGFTGTLACDGSASQIFAAFGASSGAFYPGSAYPDNASCNSSNVPITCNPGRQHIPFLEIHGNADPQISYTGGGHNGQCLPAIPYYMTYKAKQQGWGATNTTTQLGGGNVMYTWGTSASGVNGVVQHVMVNGLGHTWASNSNGFSSSPTMLSFLKQWNLSIVV